MFDDLIGVSDQSTCEDFTSEGSASLSEGSELPSAGEELSKKTQRVKLRPRGRTANPRSNRAISLPRILNSDIRRKFAVMFSNVLNSANGSLLDSFINRYRSPSFSLRKQVLNSLFAELHPGLLPPAIELEGSDVVGFYLKCIVNCSPDFAFYVENTHIKQRSDSRKTELVTDFTIVGTQLFKVNPLVVIEYMLDNLSAASSDDENINIQMRKRRKSEFPSSVVNQPCNGCEGQLIKFGEKSRVIYPHDQLRNEFAQFMVSNKFGRLDEPIQLHINGTLSFHLDENKRIEKLDFVGKSKACACCFTSV